MAIKYLRIFSCYFLLGLAGYSQVMHSFFLADDFFYLYCLANGISWVDFTVFFRPLYGFVWWINYQISGMNPLGYHIVSVLLHVLCAFMVFDTVKLILESQPEEKKDDGNAIAFVAGLLFLLLPSHTEAVSWISGRGDPLAALFCFSALSSYIRYDNTEKPLWLMGSLGLFFLALLSKESVITYPFVLPVYHFLLGNRKKREQKSIRQRRMFFGFTGSIVCLMAYFILRHQSLGEWIGGYGAVHTDFSFLKIMWHLESMLSRTFLPPVDFLPGYVWKHLSAVTVAVLFLIGFMQAKTRRRPLLFFLTAGVVLFIPVATLSIKTDTTMGERFIYLPSAWLSAAAATLLFTVLNRNWRAKAACIAAFLSLASLYTVNQNWKEAGEISQRMIGGLQERNQNDRSGKFFFPALPGSFRGAHIARNMFPPAGVFLPGIRFATPPFGALYMLTEKRQEVRVTRTGDHFVVKGPNQGQMKVLLPETENLTLLYFSRGEWHFVKKSP